MGNRDKKTHRPIKYVPVYSRDPETEARHLVNKGDTMGRQATNAWKQAESQR